MRPILGQILLEQRKTVEAEKIFRDALEKSPRYFRALTGLRDSLAAQKRVYEAVQVNRQLRESQATVDAISNTAPRK